LRARSFLIDGEAVACDCDGQPSFDRLRYRRGDGSVFLFAFDLMELNGGDLRREPLELRKATFAGLQLNQHLEHDDGDLVFRHACKLGLEGIVSKRLGSRYRSGRSHIYHFHQSRLPCRRIPSHPMAGLHAKRSESSLTNQPCAPKMFVLGSARAERVFGVVKMSWWHI
jgi:hypothetical protein